MWPFVLLFPLWIMLFKTHLCCSIYKYLIPFYGWIVFHSMYHILFINSSVDEHLGCFYFFIITNNAAMHSHIQVFVWALSIFSGKNVIVKSYHKCLGSNRLFYKKAVPFYSPSNIWRFQFLHILAITITIFFIIAILVSR